MLSIRKEYVLIHFVWLRIINIKVQRDKVSRMKEVQKEIINVLVGSDNSIISQQLADQIAVSKRTIKGNIKEINEKYPQLISSSTHGYVIDKKRAMQILSENKKTAIPQSPKERMDYILKKLLLTNTIHKEGYIDVYDLSDELIVSDATIYKDLVRINKRLEKYDLKILTSKGNIELIGTENHKRKAISDLYFTEIKKSGISIQSVQAIFTEYNVEKISDIVLEVSKRYHYFVNQYSMLNIVTYIIIGVDRIKNKFYHDISEDYDPINSIGNLRENMLVKEIAQKLEALYDFRYNDIELKELKLQIIGNLLSSDYKNLKKEDIEELIGEETVQLVTAMLKNVKNYYYFNEEDIDFFRKFSLHINNLLIRLRANYTNKNPMTDHIKYSSPLLFDCAVQMSNTILNMTGFKVSDDEIAYIALHIGTMIEEEENFKNKFKAAIIFPEYYDLASKLVEKIEKKFPEIIIVNIYTEIEDFDKKQTNHLDLVLSTIPTNNSIKNIVMINPLFTDSDVRILQQRVSFLKNDREKKRMRKLLLKITDKSFFIRNPSFRDQESIIKHMSDHFLQHDIVSANFKKDILKREQLSSTAFGNLSVPHSIQMDANKTMLYIAIFDKPINWGKKEVSIVLLFAINEESKQVFREVFDKLIVLLTEQENFEKVVNSRDLDDFICNLINI